MKKFIFSNPKLKEEFLDRFPKLAEDALAQRQATSESVELEALDVLPYETHDAIDAISEIQQGKSISSDLEAIILRFGRPAYLIQNNSFDTSQTPSSSEEVNAVVNDARAAINGAIPSVGRINLRNHRATWVGTGWLVAENVLVTNRHVASEFAASDGDSFVFVDTMGREAKASLDTLCEHDNSREIVYRLRKVLWMAPAKRSHDVAFLSVDAQSEDREVQPKPLDLMDEETLADTPVEHWTAVIGYPAYSIYNSIQDQQRIFDGIFDVKRLQPGQVVAKSPYGIINHDATTLGGNSGSVVLDLTTGKALALHFGGIEGETNRSVAAPVVAKLLREFVLGD